MEQKKKVILLAGPTASGKSKLAIKLAQYFNGEIINADSMQIYKEFSILSSRPSRHVIKKIKPALKKKKLLICDRFIDSTLAYQIYGKGVDKKFVDNIHKKILSNIKPNLTILLKDQAIYCL